MYVCIYVDIYLNMYTYTHIFVLIFVLLRPHVVQLTTPYPKAVEAEAKEILAQLLVRLDERLDTYIYKSTYIHIVFSCIYVNMYMYICLLYI